MFRLLVEAVGDLMEKVGDVEFHALRVRERAMRLEARELGEASAPGAAAGGARRVYVRDALPVYNHTLRELVETMRARLEEDRQFLDKCEAVLAVHEGRAMYVPGPEDAVPADESDWNGGTGSPVYEEPGPPISGRGRGEIWGVADAADAVWSVDASRITASHHTLNKPLIVREIIFDGAGNATELVTEIGNIKLKRTKR